MPLDVSEGEGDDVAVGEPLDECEGVDVSDQEPLDVPVGEGVDAAGVCCGGASPNDGRGGVDGEAPDTRRVE